MGRRDRERIERIRQGLEDPIARQRLADSSYKRVVRELAKGSVGDQVGRLHTMVGEGSLSDRKLREAITKNAPKEMDKAIAKFKKKGKEITVDALCAEVRSNTSFLKMCEGVGLDIGWFEELASRRIEENEEN